MGGHAITEWIASSFKHTYHYNDCFEWEATNNCWITKQYGDGLTPIDLIIHSYEDFEPSPQELMDPNTFIIMRDWFNMAASRIASNRGAGKTSRYRYESDRRRECDEVWRIYMEIYKQYPHKIINYNFWATDPDYREDVAQRLNIQNPTFTTELPKSKIGKGSSFGNSVNIDSVNERFKLLSEDELASITSDSYINHHCAEYFNVHYSM